MKTAGKSKITGKEEAIIEVLKAFQRKGNDYAGEYSEVMTNPDRARDRIIKLIDKIK